jgi:hypothetical protein
VGATFEPIGGFGWFFFCGSDGIEYYLDYILFNPVGSTVPKWRKFKRLRWVLLLNRLMDWDEILYEDDNIEDYLDFILIIAVVLTIPKWWMFKPLWWVQLLNWLVDMDDVLYGGDAIKDYLYTILLYPVASFQNGTRLNSWGGWKERLITFELIGEFGWNFIWRWWHWRWRRSHLNGGRLNFWGGATFEPIGGFWLNFVWRWWHLSWPWLHAVQFRSFNHFKMADV